MRVAIKSFLALVSLFGVTAYADTLLSFSGCNSGQTIDGVNTTAQSWSSASTLTNASISVNVGSINPGVTVTAWLMTAIGPGTTTTSQVATTTFTAPTVANFTSAPPATTVFSGLNLNPGTYYVVLSSTAGGVWEFCGTTAATGVTYGGARGALGGFNAVFPPASTFTSNARAFDMQIVGTATATVPALSEWALLALAIGLAFVGFRLIRSTPIST
jgi:hypothetical protein